jgi:hypothetical protein
MLEIPAINLPRMEGVGPETHILTRYPTGSEIEISSVLGQEIEIWNGSCWSKVIPKELGLDVPMICVDILVGTICDENNGEWEFNLHHIECGRDHQFIVKGGSDGETHMSVPAISLKRGVNLIDWCDCHGRIREAVVWEVYDYKHTSTTYSLFSANNSKAVYNGIIMGN